ncbi:MAG: phasin family protein [Pseudomonadota bacterium]
MAAKQDFKPFWDVDVTKFVGDFKVPGVDVDAMMAAQRKNLNAVAEANKLAVEGLQAVAKRQADVLKQSMEEMASTMQQLMANGAPQDKIAQQADLAKDGFEKVLANMKEVSEMVAKSNTEAAEVLSARVSEQLDEIKQTMQGIK